MSECVIIAVDRPGQWRSAPGGGKHIPPNKVCTVLQPSREVAEREALRLAKEYPGAAFVVLEAVTIARHQRVPTHVSLSGKVVADAPGSVLAAVSDEVPF